MHEPDPTAPLRRAGTAHLEDGSAVLWSVAEGRRGRRWRESVTSLDQTTSRLIETGPDGRFERLEVSSAAGLLTLHPSHDGQRLFGNVVTPDGIRHLALGWGSAHRLVASGSLASVAVACHGLEAEVPIGGGTLFRGVAVDRDLGVSEGILRIERTSASGWRVSAPAIGLAVVADLDDLGLPAGGASWPLEEDQGT